MQSSNEVNYDNAYYDNCFLISFTNTTFFNSTNLEFGCYKYFCMRSDLVDVEDFKLSRVSTYAL